VRSTSVSIYLDLNGPSKTLSEILRRSLGLSRACILLRINALRRIGHGHCAKQDALRSFSEGGPMYYVYLIESLSAARERYVGITTNLEQRVREHNAGKSSHTSKFKPWKLTAYIAFTDRAKAEAFERYLKSGSGHAFARKRLW
jgi:putative endonuclease